MLRTSFPSRTPSVLFKRRLPNCCTAGTSFAFKNTDAHFTCDEVNKILRGAQLKLSREPGPMRLEPCPYVFVEANR
jgi:hypothetical protein